MTEYSKAITSDEGKVIIRSRAEKLAQVEKKHDNKIRHKYLQVELGDNEVYGLPYMHLEEILQGIKITPIPQPIGSVIGVSNWRGRILSIVDLAELLSINQREEAANPWGIVVNYDNNYLGVVVNNVLGDDAYIEENLDKALSSTKTSEEDYILGIHDGKIAILDLKLIFQICTQEKE